MRAIRDFPLAAFTAGMWRLGHGSLVLRIKDGPVIAVDPYLTDSAAAESPRMRRRFPPPFPPAALDADLVLITHTHVDHLDPATISASPARTRAVFLGPASVRAALLGLGVPEANAVRLDAGGRWQGMGLTVEAVRAWHTPDVPDAVGFVVDAGPGMRISLTGDTGWDDGLAAVRPADVLVLPINGKLGNMGVEAAARLVREVRPRYAVPAHHDLIAANGEDPEAFLLSCEMAGVEERACVLPAMRPLLLAGPGPAIRVTRQLSMVWNATEPVKDIALPPGYRLRAFREPDIPALGDIYRRTFGPDHDATWYRREFLSSPLFSPDRVMVVEKEGVPVATALAWEDGAREVAGRGVLHFVATHPDHHQRGLGKAVSAAVQAWFRRQGRTGVFLLTDDERLRAIRAYTTLGFRPVEDDDEMRARWTNVRAAVDALKAVE